MNSYCTRILVAVVALTFMSTAASADLILTLHSGGNSIYVVDNAPSGTLSGPAGAIVSNVADGSATPGVITFSGSVGNFTVNVTTGLSKPTIGPRRIDLNSVNVTGNSAGSVFIYLADTDFTHPDTGPHSLITKIGGTTDGTVTGTAGWNSSNSEGGFSNVHTFGPFGPGAFSDEMWAPINLTGGSKFTLGHAVTITHTGAQQVTSLDVETSIPEPASLALLLVGAGAFALRRRRR